MRLVGIVGMGLCIEILGCGSSPNATFYALSAENGATQACAPHDIKIRRPGLAGYLDRPEIVRRIVDFRLSTIPNDRWGEPLDAMVARVLALDIEQRLPRSITFTEDGSITADADATVEIDLQRFDGGSDGNVILLAKVAVTLGTMQAPSTSRTIALREKPREATTSALVATMSDLLAQLADYIAGGICRSVHEGSPQND